MPVKEEPRDPKESVAVDLDAVKARTIALGKRHRRSADELDAMVQTATRVAARLAEDQRAALYPDVDNPFIDELDVVNRLLPYHVFQQPKEDLETLIQYGTPLPSRKGKRKATEEDLLREEIADTKFALECWKRKRALERRFMKARVNTGKRASPADQGYVLAQAVLEVERAETAALNAELKAARAELDKIEREKRAAAPPPSTPAPKPTPTVRTSNASNYYSSSATPTTATFMPPYRPPYSYSYSQYPSTQYSYNPHAYSSYTPTTTYSGASQTPATPTTVYNPPASVASATPTSAASAQVQQAQASPASAISNTAIPVQLPVNSLPALAALGIVPVAAASLPPAGQTQPPAVIKSTNGSMLSLEINLSLLQSAQMSGLVLILNALTSRGVNVDGSTTSTGLGAGAPAASATSAGSSANGSNGAAPLPATSSGLAAAASAPSTSSGSASPSPVSAS
ncbi:hypothetical protein L226DRAFT_464222 [Lentinus tigrinus ALCF2SS1-7]|uniref:uncharacterized protein n=1 Tax=Lentinus tigrinus ALCF2SS1-7 TaxID=1328758 RepID=UPI00116636BE|nr:hypothetical protein L226DRAFT_464222 [Lentinus tigrinus ALCF2SS1-7]